MSLSYMFLGDLECESFFKARSSLFRERRIQHKYYMYELGKSREKHYLRFSKRLGKKGSFIIILLFILILKKKKKKKLYRLKCIQDFTIN
jgi:hypothetical protein